ncbi:S8 family serine peptidase, partial [Micromonospora sp. SL1-18]|uniref:S8 family serine peptidase n=1 Tax=Micromonospora sp. SL1-18 TaxID=3399128 RepID=UPI003A4DEB62
ASVTHKYRSALQGFAGRMSERQARRLAADPRVAYVQQDGVFTITATQTNPPSWGLDRIDQRNQPLSGSYTYNSTAS